MREAVLPLYIVGGLLMTGGIILLPFDVSMLPAIVYGCQPFGSNASCLSPLGPSGGHVTLGSFLASWFLYIAYPLTAVGILCFVVGYRMSKSE